MRFHKQSTTPAYFSRRDQIRLFRLVAAIGVIFIAMHYASKPSSWYWLTGRPENAPAAQQNEVAQQEVDFSVKQDTQLEPDEFRSEPTPEMEPPPDANPRLENGEFDVRVDPRLLNPVTDSTLGVRKNESNALYYLLAKAAAIPQNTLEQSATPAPPFVVLMNESPRYRGELITVRGRLKRLTPMKVNENSYDIQHLYEGWFFSKDSGTHPWRVLCTKLPKDIPQGTDLQNMPAVQITGYYFKKYGYPSAAQKLQTAPLLIAGQIRWFPPAPAETASSSGAAKYVVSLFLVISIALAFMVWRFTINDQKFARSKTARLMERPEMSMESLNNIETVDINDVLKQLGEQDQSDQKQP